jgi:diguanylate cyclase (GGDEF)-like protein/PAS domain S-box-containing protein
VAQGSDREGERLRIALAGSGDGLWDWDVGTGRVFTSASFQALLGREEIDRESDHGDWLTVVRPEDRAAFDAALSLHVARRDRLECELRMKHASGAELWMLVRGAAQCGPDGEVLRVTGLMTDITQRKRTELHLIQDAFRDVLTGLPNRAVLLDRIGQAIDRRRRPEDAQFAVLLIDLDGFREINHRLGPVASDQLLRTVATRLAAARRVGDTVAHLSGDAFGLLMEGIIDVQAAVAAADRLAAVVAEPIEAEGGALSLTVSVGIALSGNIYRGPEDMLRDAQLAMARAKAAGRSRVEVFDEAQRETVRTRLRTESDLRQAIARCEFRLEYQPIVDLRSERIAGFEALIRWHSPERGLVLPADFIPLAEEVGLILPIGCWALLEATRQLAEWHRRFGPDLFISVNVSSRQFIDDDIVAIVDKALEASGIPPASLKLEITETLLMDDPLRCVATLQAIKSRGVALSLDDFGTGFSSLNYLNRYPIDTLKIDRSFVKATAGGERRAAIARTITLLAQAMDMDVVAEGIETETELAFLRGLHCQFGQGFYFSPPHPPEAIEVLLAGR